MRNRYIMQMCRCYPLLSTVIFLAFCLMVAETSSFFYYRVLGNDKSPRVQTLPPFFRIGWSGFDDVGREIKKILSYMDGYFLYDPSLGVRFTPNSAATVMGVNPEGSLQVKPKYSLPINSYGFIAGANSSTDQTITIAKDPAIFKILVSGGSTVAGWGASNIEKTWPNQLENLLNAKRPAGLRQYKKIVVFNTGVFGYNISQEIKLFTTETAFYQPDLVISFNGINERWGYFGDALGYGESKKHFDLKKVIYTSSGSEATVLFPFISLLVRKSWDWISGNEIPKFGYMHPEYIKHDAKELYLSKIQIFKNLSEAVSSDFLYFLQPTMAVCAKQLTDEEETMTMIFGTPMGSYRKSWVEFGRAAKEFYSKISSNLREGWQYDLSCIFEDEVRTVYFGPRHYNDFGQELIAREIAKIIDAKYREGEVGK